MSRDDRNGNAGEAVDNGRGPAAKRAVAGAIGVVGAAEVESLVLRGRLGGDALSGNLGQGGAKGGSVGEELAVDVAHGEGVVPEVDECPDAIAFGRQRVVVWHGNSCL